MSNSGGLNPGSDIAAGDTTIKVTTDPTSTSIKANVGTAAGTVAAGDDARFGQVGGVTVTGSPSSGKVLTATSDTEADWSAPQSDQGGTVTQVSGVDPDGDGKVDLSEVYPALTGGVIDADAVPDLDADKITTGTLDSDRIPDLSGTYARPTAIVNGSGGIADQSADVDAAVAAVAGGGNILIGGKVRYATKGSGATSAAIDLSGLSNVSVMFVPGAELILDNLDDDGEGTSHGILCAGSASNIRIVDARVRWASAPSARSIGDGFRFLGYPSDDAPPADWTGSTGTVSDVHLIRCTTVNAPQTGAIFMGCSDVHVRDFHAESTLADGLHFNACRRVSVDGHTAVNTGDDGLAFVTYYDDTDIWQDAAGGPFNQPSVGAWSNDQSTASNIIVNNSAANGIRLAGSRNVAISSFSINGAAATGVITDAGPSGGTYSWTVQASLGCTVVGGTVNGCDSGILARTYNADFTDDSGYWQFDVLFDAIDISDCTTRAVNCYGFAAGTGTAGVNFGTVTIHGTSSLFGSMRNARIDTVVSDDLVLLYGNNTQPTDLAATQTNGLSIGTITAATIYLQDLRGANINTMHSQNSDTTGIRLTRVADVEIGSITVRLPNRSNSGTTQALLLSATQHVHIGTLDILHDDKIGTAFYPIEIGGGSATDIADDTTIQHGTYRNTLDASTSGVVLQGGTYAPTNWRYDLRFYNGGEDSPTWRRERKGSTGWADEFIGTGAPAFTAPIGSTYKRTDGGTGTTLYVNEDGTSTGWVAK